MSTLEQRLLPIWRTWQGVIPVWAARQAGIRPDNLRRWAGRNPDVDRVGHGVYAWYPDMEEDTGIDWRLQRLAIALGEAGPESRLWGPSALEAMGLGTVGGGPVRVSVPTRRRRRDDIGWRPMGNGPTVRIHGLPSQSVYDALASSRSELDDDKYLEAVMDARNRRLISQRQYDALMIGVGS